MKYDMESIFLGLAGLILFSSSSVVQKDLLDHCGFLITHSVTYIAVIFCAVYVLCRNVFVASFVTLATILLRQASITFHQHNKTNEKKHELDINPDTSYSV